MMGPLWRFEPVLAGRLVQEEPRRFEPTVVQGPCVQTSDSRSVLPARIVTSWLVELDGVQPHVSALLSQWRLLLERIF